MSKEYDEVRENIRYRFSQAKTENKRTTCPKAKKFMDEFFKGSVEAWKIAEAKVERK